MSAHGLFTTASILDPAIDFDAMSQDEVGEFLHGDKRDVALLKVKPGQALTIYTLREIPDDTFDAVVAVHGTQAAQFSAAFRAAVVRVDRGFDRYGKPLPHPWRPASIARGSDKAPEGVVFALSAVELAEFDRPTVQEIGGVAYSRSVFCLRGRVVRWLLPPLSLETFRAAHTRRLAVPDVSTASPAGTSSAPPASPPAAPTTSAVPTTGGESGSPGAAPVTASRTGRPGARSRLK